MSLKLINEGLIPKLIALLIPSGSNTFLFV